jgi:hypothetical protein
MDTAPVATQGISPDRPWPASSGLRSSVAGFASPDRRRENPSAISRALSPIAHRAHALMTLRPQLQIGAHHWCSRACSTMDPSCRRTGCLISSLPPGGNTRGVVARMFQAGSRQGNKSLRRRSGSTDGS